MAINTNVPAPLTVEELRTAKQAVASSLDMEMDLMEDSESIMWLLGAWNALEDHLSYLEKRPRLNVLGVDPESPEGLAAANDFFSGLSVDL